MRLLILVGFLLVAVFAFGGNADAQSTGEETVQSEPAVKIVKRKLLVQPRNADGTLQQTSIWEDPVLWIRDQQQNFYSSMSVAIRKMRSDASFAATWTLLGLSFGYGIFHAAGPGHGKAVISAWLLATENELKRGVLIAFMSSIVQALSAILIVSTLLLVVASVGATARNVAGVMESASYAMIGLMGLYLIWTAIRPHGHVHVHDLTHHDHHHGHHIQEPHQHDKNCGHAHVPEARQVRGGWSLAKAFSLSFAVGMRPCTGAILVLVFANVIGLYWAGIASTLVMSLGTFLTVSIIAAVAVYAKRIALTFAARDSKWLGRTAITLRIGGGLAIACLGGLLFLGSLGNVNAIM